MTFFCKTGVKPTFMKEILPILLQKARGATGGRKKKGALPGAHTEIKNYLCLTKIS